MSLDRIARLNPELQKTLAEVISERIETPLDLLITITKAHVSDNLMHATISVSVLPDSKEREGMAFLIRNRKQIQKELGRRWRNHMNTPKLLFKFDDTNKRVAEINELIDEEGSVPGNQ
jgi:ribosome-binding factor A